MTWTFHKLGLDNWKDRPELAPYFARVVQCWAGIEWQLAMIFAILSGGHLAHARVHHDIPNIHTSARVLRTLAKTQLGKADYLTLDDLLRRAESSSTKRNKIVHGFWSIRDDKPDEIFLEKMFPTSATESKAIPYTKQRFLDTANKFLELYKDLDSFHRHILWLSRQEPFPRSALLAKK